MTTRIKPFSVKTILAAAMGAALPLLALPGSAKACSGEPILGTICVVGFNFCPRGFAEADGRLIAISSNSALFSLLGTTYGGDGRTTFALPDLRGRMVIGQGRGPGLSMVTWGERRGSERRTITTVQMPSHTHTAQAEFTPSGGSGASVTASNAPGDRAAPEAGDYLGAVDVPGPGTANIYTDTQTDPVELGGVSGGGTVEVRNMNTGGSQPLETTDPSLGMKVCIATVGLYPSRE